MTARTGPKALAKKRAGVALPSGGPATAKLAKPVASSTRAISPRERTSLLKRVTEASRTLALLDGIELHTLQHVGQDRLIGFVATLVRGWSLAVTSELAWLEKELMRPTRGRPAQAGGTQTLAQVARATHGPAGGRPTTLENSRSRAWKAEIDCLRDSLKTAGQRGSIIEACREQQRRKGVSKKTLEQRARADEARYHRIKKATDFARRKPLEIRDNFNDLNRLCGLLKIGDVSNRRQIAAKGKHVPIASPPADGH